MTTEVFSQLVNLRSQLMRKVVTQDYRCFMAAAGVLFST